MKQLEEAGAKAEIEFRPWQYCGCFQKIGVFPPNMDGANNGKPY